MKVIVNKKKIDLPKGSSLIDLLNHLKWSKAIAVFINGKQLLISEYDNYILENNDIIKIFKLSGGG